MEELNRNASPILIVRVPFDRTEDEVANIFMDFEESPINDEYNVLVLKNYDSAEKEIQFECVNSNHSALDFEKLKNKILRNMETSQINRYKNKS